MSAQKRQPKMQDVVLPHCEGHTVLKTKVVYGGALYCFELLVPGKVEFRPEVARSQSCREDRGRERKERTGESRSHARAGDRAHRRA